MICRLLIAASIALAGHARAAEGLWQPRELPEIEAALHAAGIAVDPRQLADLQRYPMNAVVDFGGTCSAALVSSLGLLVTNHHCARSSLQAHATADRDLWADGFVAPTLGEELPADAGLRVRVTQSVQDVTAQVLARSRDGNDDRGRLQAIEARKRRLVAACESAPGSRCRVHAFHDGAEYFLVRQLEIRDLRLAYAPAAGVGAFGGAGDHWRWPRHAGDFALFRAYVGPDGKPADYSESNVPMRPASHLKLQPGGIAAGDFAMAVGYPGVTRRHRLAAELEQALAHDYPAQIGQQQRWLDLIATHTRGRPLAERRYAALVATLEDDLARLRSSVEQLARADLVASRNAEEAAILEWAQANGHAQAGAAHAAWRASLAARPAHAERARLLRGLRSTTLATASDLVRLAAERGKPDAERASGFQRRDEARIAARVAGFDQRFDATVDRALLADLLGRLLALPQDLRLPELGHWLGAQTADAGDAKLAQRLDQLYAGSKIFDAAERARWLAADRRGIERNDDPMLQLAQALAPALQRAEQAERDRRGRDERLAGAWMAVRIAHARAAGRPLYADGNGSLRVSFGTVRGEPTTDGATGPAFSNVAGLLARHTGVAPFDAGARLAAAIAGARFGPYAVDGTAPVNFLADLDVARGSSGSPVLNARAELVGLVFDGNRGAVAADWGYDASQSRAIAVDIRYLLWMLDAVDGAHRLLQEIGVEPAFADAPG